MARFGLVESDSDSEASTSSQSTPATPNKNLKKSQSTTNQFQHSSSSNSEGEDEEEEVDVEEDEDDSAPPRASLMSTDEEDDSNEDEEEDQEMSEEQPTFSSTPRGKFQSKQTRSRQANSSYGEDDEEEDDNSSIYSNHRSQRSLSALPSNPRLQTNNTTSTTREPWPQTLKLESKRVAVMQASFFNQNVDKSIGEKNAEKERELIKERKRKEAAISAAAGNRKDDSMFVETASRPNFSAPLIDPKPFRQFRKYTRVELSTSISNGKEGNVIDSGLMLGRSYKVGWGPEGKIVHLSGLYGIPGSSKSDTISISKIKTVSQSSSFEAAAALRTLEIQLSHTPIYSDSTTQIPFAVTHPELRFSNFVSTDRSPEAHLWRLGHALFDEIEDLSIPENVSGDYSRHVVEIRRKERLEKWLEDVVKGDVEEDLRDISGSSSGAKRVFALLSGHQIERACEAAIEAGDLRLATLLAQAGGDDEFREDIYLQLAKWREYRVDSHISNAYRRVYEVLCGNVGRSEGVAKGDVVNAADEIHIAEGLDWKRTFGLHLWYGTYQLPLSTTVERYEQASKEDNKVASPLPSYIERPNVKDSKTTMWKPSTQSPQDPLFELIKIFTNSTHSLESALLPRNFGSSPLDYRLPWHLYVLFSRVLRRRDFEDRTTRQEGMERDGNSARADMVTESYATQLELNGMWKWAVFILLHLEIPDRRAKAIKEVLARYVDEIDEEQMVFLVETLKVPETWIYSAQAVAAKYNGDIWAEYQLLLLAEQFGQAHEIAVLELAPEAVLRNDMVLLRKLFEPFEPSQVSEWEAGGKIFLQYADCVEHLKLVQSSPSGDRLLLDLIHSVPNLVERPQGGIKLKIAVTEMQSRLTAISSAFEKHANAIRPSTLQEADRLVWMKGINSNFFSESLQQALA